MENSITSQAHEHMSLQNKIFYNIGSSRPNLIMHPSVENREKSGLKSVV